MRKCFKFAKETSSNLGEEKIFRGIVGEMIAYVHKIPLFINGNEIETRVAFVLSEVPNLIGRLDIFKNFEITF